MIRFGAYFLIILSLVLLADAAVDQISSKAKAISPNRSFQIVQASKEKDPELFKSIMSYQWIRASALLGGGCFLLSMIRRADKLDPFST